MKNNTNSENLRHNVNVDSGLKALEVPRLVVLLVLLAFLYLAFFAFVPTQVGSQIRETLLSLWEAGPIWQVALYLGALYILGVDLLLIGLAALGIHVRFVDKRSEKNHSKNRKQALPHRMEKEAE